MQPSQENILNKKMLVEEVVSKLKYFSKLYGIKSIFVVGGYCRSRHQGETWTVNDIDVASAFHEQALQLGGLFASEILKTSPIFYQRTGTAAVMYSSKFGDIRVEFQGNSINKYMYNQEVRNWMKTQNIEDIPLMNNIYGRDFTINSLIYSLHNGVMYDPTERGINDFDKKVIKSLLPAKMLIKYSPLSALRAIRFAIKYKFIVDSDLRKAIRSAGMENLVKTISEERIVKDVVKILKIDGNKGLKMLEEFNLDGILLHPSVKDYIYLGTKGKKHVNH